MPHPADRHPSLRTWTRQVGALRASGNAGARRGLPRFWCWFQMVEAASHRVEHSAHSSHVPVSDTDVCQLCANASTALRRLFQRVKAQRTSRTPSKAEPPREPRRQVELAALADRELRDDLRQRLSASVLDVETGAARESRMDDALRAGHDNPVAAGLPPRARRLRRDTREHGRPAAPRADRGLGQARTGSSRVPPATARRRTRR